MAINTVKGHCEATIVCVDKCENGVWSGRLYNPCRNDGVEFKGIIPFLRQVESFLNESHFPQTFCEKRFFKAGTETSVTVFSSDESRYGTVATFSVKVLFRQNASWQGSISWIEGKQEESFRSVFELLMLMDSVLSDSDD